MALLFSSEILDAVKTELINADESVQIITAYCKEKTIKTLDQYIKKDIPEKRIMLRFRLDDLVKGSTDFSVIEHCLENGWDVYIRFDLHAKTYIVDNKRGLVGSANATSSGLNIGSSGNVEMGTIVDIEPQDIEKIRGLFKYAVPVDTQLYQKLKEQYQKCSISDKTAGVSWDDSIIKLFAPRIDTLFSHEFPDKKSYQDGEYVEFMECCFDDEFKHAFRYSTAYLWLLSVLENNDGELYFGKLSAIMHNALVSDPKPYRKDVKDLLSNFLSLVEQLNMEEVVIDKPNYSQRVYLKEMRNEF